MNNWIEQLIPIMKEYMDGDDEPMDGDAVDDLCVILRAKMNLHQGNITEAEYEEACNEKDIYKSADSISHDWDRVDITDMAERLNIELTEEEIKRVMHLIISEHDANNGINYDVIESWVEYVENERDKK